MRGSLTRWIEYLWLIHEKTNLLIGLLIELSDEPVLKFVIAEHAIDEGAHDGKENEEAADVSHEVQSRVHRSLDYVDLRVDIEGEGHPCVFVSPAPKVLLPADLE